MFGKKKTPCSSCGRTNTHIVFDKETQSKFMLCQACMVTTKLNNNDLPTDMKTTPVVKRGKRRTPQTSLANARRARHNQANARAMARHIDEGYGKQELEEIMNGNKPESSINETKMNWTDRDGTKSIFKFDGDGNLIGRETK